MRKVFLFLLLISKFSFAQNKTEIDSLEIEIKNTNSIDEKIKLHDLLYNRYFLIDKEKAHYQTQQLFELGEKHNNNLAFYKANYLKGVENSMLSNKEQAINYLEKAIYYAKKIQNNSLLYESTIKLGNVYIKKNEFNKAQFYISQAIQIAKKDNQLEELSRAYMILGESYHNKKAYVLALNNYLKTDSIHDIHKLDRNILGENYVHLGQLYHELKLYNQSEKYFNQAKAIFDQTTNKLGQIHAIFKLGDVYFSKKEYNRALKNYQKAYEFYSSINFIDNIAETKMSIGKIFSEQKNYKTALTYFQNSLELQKSANNYLGQAKTYTNIADVYFKLNDYENAKKYYLQALNLSNEHHLYAHKTYLYVKLAKFYNKINDFTNATKYYNLNEIIKDSIANLNENQKIFELETKFQTENKQKQIKLLSAQNELEKKEKYFYISLLTLLILIGFGLLFIYRNKIKTAQKIKELNELKSVFFANISHEFRTPLTLIKSPVQSLQSEISDENQKNKLRLIDTNSSRMLELVDQLLELSKIDSGNLSLKLKEENISSFLHTLIEPFEFEAKVNNINFSSSIEKADENSLFDKDIIQKIITNLLSNAFKYTSANEQITFHSSVKNSILEITVSNTGSTIKKEDLSKLFDRFYQKNDSNKGVGIGLALVKELVHLHNGSIDTKLKKGEISFNVSLPITTVQENTVLKNQYVEEISTLENSFDDDLPVLLIVDDNTEIRNVIIDVFKSDYTILEANDGKEALKIAQKEIPDCIISDVMMPNMNGFEFVKNTKNHELTSFIPVILLTAKSSDEAHLEGLKNKADAYLTKPFNNSILKEMVNQLITERKKLHQRYSQELVLKPVDIVINSVDETFIKKLQKVLDKELSNAEFNVEKFASELGISRMQLHRKLKSLLGVSATEFLRNERLKTASELLKKNNQSISDVAYAVGFNDVSYFSKCFKEMYQFTPSEYIERN